VFVFPVMSIEISAWQWYISFNAILLM